MSGYMIRTAGDLEMALVAALGQGDVEAVERMEDELRDVATFADACLLTRDRGVVLRFASGAEFQVGIVRSERPEPAFACLECDDEFATRDAFVGHLIDAHGWSREDAAVEGAAR